MAPRKAGARHRRWHRLMDPTALMRRTLKTAALVKGGRQAAVWLPGTSAAVEVITSKAFAEARTNDRPPFNLSSAEGRAGIKKKERRWGGREPQGRSLGNDFTSKNIGKSRVMNVPAEEVRTHQWNMSHAG